MLQRAVSQAADSMFDALAILRDPLNAEELIMRARRRMSLVDFGATPFEEPLRNLLRACREEAELSLFGRFATRWDAVRFLSNLLRLREEERRAPEILEQQVERPLRVFGLLAPEFRRMHPIDAFSPQECSEITAHVFASLRFDTTYHVPSYRRWLDEAGHLDAYRFHKRFLQHLQYKAAVPGHWVLKCPDHIFALGALRAVYPDAGIVFVHRDPLAVLLSVARLTEVLRRPFARRVDRRQIGRQDSDRWLAATEV